MAVNGQRTTFEMRLEIANRWRKGQGDREIAAALMLSQWTVRKWRRKYQQEGRAGLVSRMGRPAKGALGQSSAELQNKINEMREAHPGWGAVSIRTELQTDPIYSQVPLPSRSRIAAFLKQEKWAQKRERRTEMPQPDVVQPEQVHQVWQLDAQGVVQVAGLGAVTLINVKDLFSRVIVASYPCFDPARPTHLDYQLVLRRAFVDWGLPVQISLDHDAVFFDNASASPYPSLIHLWLIGLGIDVRFIKKKPPLEHSVIERTHQTVYQQAMAGQSFTDVSVLSQSISDRLDFLNQRYPSLALGKLPPLLAYPEAKHTQRPYRLEWEAEMLDIQQIYNYLTKGRWFRLTSSRGQFSLGAYRYNAKSQFAHQTLEITIEPLTRELVCLTEDGQQTIRFPCQGLSKTELIGELDPLITLPSYQLELPFSQAAWRELMLCHVRTGTTL